MSQYQKLGALLIVYYFIVFLVTPFFPFNVILIIFSYTELTLLQLSGYATLCTGLESKGGYMMKKLVSS